MKYLIIFTFLVFSLQADDLQKLKTELGHKEFKVRKEAKVKIKQLCEKKPELLEKLYLITQDSKDIEVRESCKEIIEKVVKHTLFVERGCLGLALDEDKILYRVVAGPAKDAGFENGWKMLSIEGKDCSDKTVAEIYKIIHGSKPGEKLEVVLEKADGKKVTLHPVTAPRSNVRDDENVKKAREEFYKNWLDKIKQKAGR